MKTQRRRFFRNTVLAAAFMMHTVWSQSDPLASKSISLLLADQDKFWAFAADGAQYSLLDPFVTPVTIKNGALPFGGYLRGGIGRTVSVLVFQNYLLTDSVTVGGIAAIGRDGKVRQDSLRFSRHGLHKNATTSGVEVSALALRADTLVIGFGNAGIAYTKVKPEGQGAIVGDTLNFLSLPQDLDTATLAFRCAVNKVCSTDSLDQIPKKFGTPDSITSLAIDEQSPDSVWLLVGTHVGLRRGILGGKVFPAVKLPSDKSAKTIRIERIYADASRKILWVFSGSEYFFSSDHGKTFKKPAAISGVGTSPATLNGFKFTPSVVNDGDTSFLNLNLDRPGLVSFRKDTILANTGSGDFGDVIFDRENGLDITTSDGRLTSLAIARSGNVTALGVGASYKGLFIRKTGSGQDGIWTNINSLKRLEEGLTEVITFPTLFTGVRTSGEPDYVHFGYRLKKDGKVTIRVFNYAMEPVVTIVDHAPRKGGGARSESQNEDRWDGRDSSGRPVSLGTYYILVESDQGEKGWGKAIAARGRD